jgi:hypothetical protein
MVDRQSDEYLRAQVIKLQGVMRSWLSEKGESVGTTKPGKTPHRRRLCSQRSGSDSFSKANIFAVDPYFFVKYNSLDGEV